MYIYTCEISVSLTTGGSITHVLSEPYSCCPIGVENAKYRYKKSLSQLKDSQGLVDFIVSLCYEFVNIDEYKELANCLDEIAASDFSLFKRIDIDITSGELGGVYAERSRLVYDFTTGKGSRSFEEIDPDDIF